MFAFKNIPKFLKPIAGFYEKIKYKKVQQAELKWWQKKGLSQGTKHYSLYHEIFEFGNYDFSDSIFIDVGGGMFPIHSGFKCRRKILVDPLIEEYMKIKGFVPSSEIEYYTNFEQIRQKKEFADVISCFNTLDHALDPTEVVKDIYKHLKMNGLFFVYSHIGNPMPGPHHPHCLYREDYLSMIDEKFSIIEEFDLEDEKFRKINRYPAFAAVCKKDIH